MEAPSIMNRRPMAAEAPRPARPIPPANTGLLKSASRVVNDVVDGSGIFLVMGESFCLSHGLDAWMKLGKPDGSRWWGNFIM